ncbi:MAG: peroxiredoxin [Crocinitomicaceae bacterium]
MTTIKEIPSFKAKDDKGHWLTSDELLGQPLVLFFYPKDFSPGCTAEVCSFRDSFQDFNDVGARVIGISQDDEASHKGFIEKHSLPFQLLSDENKELRKLFGVKGDLFGLIPGRETFVFDSKGKLIHHFRSQTKFEKHVAESIQAIRDAEKKVD